MTVDQSPVQHTMNMTNGFPYASAGGCSARASPPRCARPCRASLPGAPATSASAWSCTPPAGRRTRRSRRAPRRWSHPRQSRTWSRTSPASASGEVRLRLRRHCAGTRRGCGECGAGGGWKTEGHLMRSIVTMGSGYL